MKLCRMGLAILPMVMRSKLSSRKSPYSARQSTTSTLTSLKSLPGRRQMSKLTSWLAFMIATSSTPTFSLLKVLSKKLSPS